MLSQSLNVLNTAAFSGMHTSSYRMLKGERVGKGTSVNGQALPCTEPLLPYPSFRKQHYSTGSAFHPPECISPVLPFSAMPPVPSPRHHTSAAQTAFLLLLRPPSYIVVLRNQRRSALVNLVNRVFCICFLFLFSASHNACKKTHRKKNAYDLVNFFHSSHPSLLI